MNNTKKRIKASPENVVLRVLSNELKFDLTASKRKEALVTMARSLAFLFRDLGIPQKWMKRITFSPDAIERRTRREPKTIIPKKAAELVDALTELFETEQSSELAFWGSEALAEINVVLDSNLIR